MPDASRLTPYALPFDEAIAHFRAKGYAISPESWRDVWQDAHARSFTVARVTAMDVLRDLKAEVQRAMTEGVSLADFKKNLIPTLTKKGWFAPKGEAAKIEMPDGTIRKRLTPWRLDLIWRTNLQTAYSVGRYKQMTDPDVAEMRPYWQYKAILDRVTRPAHAAMHNKVYDYRHPIWNTWFPPNGFHCRCYVKTLSEEQLRERGLKAEVEPPGKFEPDEGWRYNVGEAGMNAGWTPELGKYPALIKQEFLEDLLDRTCPDDWADFSGSQCYKRLKKQLKQSDLNDLETLVWARKEGGVEGFGDWVRDILTRPDDSAARGEIYPAGNLPLQVLARLTKQPRLALVVVEDRTVRQLPREAKRMRGAALTAEEIEAIPERFNTAAWYLDKEDPALLMTWVRQGDLWLKAVIRMDVSVGRGVANRIVSGGMVRDFNLERDARYEKL